MPSVYTARVPRRDAWIGAGLTVASAVLFGLAFPPTGWLPLAWAALAPFFVALRSGGVGRATLLTWLWCLVAAWVIGDWFATSVAFSQVMMSDRRARSPKVARLNRVSSRNRPKDWA